MQKQNQNSKLVIGLLALTLIFSVIATVSLNHAYAESSSKQIKPAEEMAKKETQSALKETRKDAQQSAIKTREMAAENEKALKAGKNIPHPQAIFQGHNVNSWMKAHLQKTANVVCGLSLCNDSLANAKVIHSHNQKEIDMAKFAEAQKALQILKTMYRAP